MLEFGPGVGRTLEAYYGRAKISGYDITGNYEHDLQRRAREIGLGVDLTVAKEAEERLPFGARTFDAGVACQVLMHQRPERVKFVMEELVRVCRKVIVVTGGYGLGAHPSAKHVFAHDYPTICTSLGCEMDHVQARPPKLYFVYQRVTE